MAKPRVHEIASDYGLEFKVLQTHLRSMGEFIKGPSSSIAPPVARKLRDRLEADGHERRLPAIPLSVADEEEAGALAMQLPRSLPRLIDHLTVGRKLREEARLLAESLDGRHLWFVPTAMSAVPRAASLSEDDLPSPAGFAYIRTSQTRAQIVAWATRGHRLTVGAVAVQLRNRQGSQSGTSPRLTIGPMRSVSSELHDGMYIAGFSSPAVGLIVAMIAAIPTREVGKGEGNHQSSEPMQPRGDQSDDVRLVYVKRTLGAHGRALPLSHRDSRWSVRGHWRQQWYSSTEEHRRLWIETHEAGRGAGEVKPREVVNVVAGVL